MVVIEAGGMVITRTFRTSCLQMVHGVEGKGTDKVRGVALYQGKAPGMEDRCLGGGVNSRRKKTCSTTGECFHKYPHNTATSPIC